MVTKEVSIKGVLPTCQIVHNYEATHTKTHANRGFFYNASIVVTVLDFLLHGKYIVALVGGGGEQYNYMLREKNPKARGGRTLAEKCVMTPLTLLDDISRFGDWGLINEEHQEASYQTQHYNVFQNLNNEPINLSS